MGPGQTTVQIMKVSHHFLIPHTDTDCQWQEPASAQQSFSKSQEPAVWRAIPVLEYLEEKWETFVNDPQFDKLSEAIHGGLENIRKWYQKTDDSDTYFICLGKPLRKLMNNVSNVSF